MDEDIEVQDVNGNIVRVPLYGALAFIADHLARRPEDQIPDSGVIEVSTTTVSGHTATLLVERGFKRDVS